jgi:hypothetical protein
VESGGAILQPAYALRTTLAFPNAKLEFLPLVCLLGVIQILESRDHPDNRRLLAEQMRQAEPRLAFVLDSLGGLDSSAMSTPESLSRCMHAVLAFLQTPLSSPEPPVDVRGSVEAAHRFQNRKRLPTKKPNAAESFAKAPRNRVTFEMDEPGWDSAKLYLEPIEDGTDVSIRIRPQIIVQFDDGA